MQLEVEEIKALEPVKFNYEELKTQLMTKVENYKSIVYTEDTMKNAKADRANFNKLAKALNDEKIRVRNHVLELFEIGVFEKQCNELIELAKDASNHIDTQVKAFEQQKKDDKLKQIMNFFIENVGDYKELIDFDKIFNERWLNVTYKMEQIETDILHIFTKTKTDMNVIDSQFQDENVNKQVKMEYFFQIANPSVLTLAILKGNSIIQNNKKLEELKEKEASSQNITKSEEKITNNSQNITQNQENVAESEELQILDFRVHVTQRQKFALREFLKSNNIKFEPVPYGKVKKEDLIKILQYCGHIARLVSPADATKYGLNNFDGAISDFIRNVIYHITNNQEINLHSSDKENFATDIMKRMEIDLKNMEE
nr:MAG TPA: Protein of unknown function (DUF1351) [Caudoviricetes sp.]